MSSAIPSDTVFYRPLVEAGAMWPLIIGYGLVGLISDSIHVSTGIVLLVFGILVHCFF